ncbi:MAG: hypothetical protein ACXABY_30240, partial [Candidatus Thorarchaeota archaeon]
MTLQLWEQSEWHGIARRGQARKNPNTSYAEFNTVPGSGKLQKILARYPYLSGRLPIPAARFDDGCGKYVLMDKNDAHVYFDKNGETFKAYCCFKVDDYSILDTTRNPTIFCSGRAPGTTTMPWGFYLEEAAGVWTLTFQVRDGANVKQVQHATALVSGSWYWSFASVTATTATLTTYKDGSGTPLETDSDATLTRPGFSESVKPLCIGDDHGSRNFLYGGAVAFAALTTTGLETKTAWTTDFRAGATTNCSFRVFNPRASFQPALLSDTTNEYVWRQYPRQHIEAATVTSAASGFYDASGILS